MKLKDQVAIVTGAGRGIGKAICEVLDREGARVVLQSRTESQLKEVAAGLTNDCLVIPGDVSDEDHVNSLAKQTLERFGRIDILVNNAGIFIVKSLVDTTPEEWDRVQDINLKGAYLCCRAVVPHMMEKRSGKIVNIMSGAAIQGFENFSAYCASKWGMGGLTQALAMEVADYDIDVNGVNPGRIRTEMTRVFHEKDGPAHPLHPKDRWYEPELVADAVLYLATQPKGTISAQFINVVRRNVR